MQNKTGAWRIRANAMSNTGQAGQLESTNAAGMNEQDRGPREAQKKGRRRDMAAKRPCKNRRNGKGGRQMSRNGGRKKVRNVNL